MLQILQSKFDDLKQRVEVNADRFNQCEEFATKLITSETTYAADIEKRQDQLRLVFLTIFDVCMTYFKMPHAIVLAFC